MSYVGFGQPDQDAPLAAVPADDAAAAMPAVQTSKADDWCREIAKAARENAAGNGFDAATQQRRAQAVYQQCLHFGSGSP